METPFDGGRHMRRVAKIHEIEAGAYGEQGPSAKAAE
jgi:hypothetical protein